MRSSSPAPSATSSTASATGTSWISSTCTGPAGISPPSTWPMPPSPWGRRDWSPACCSRPAPARDAPDAADRRPGPGAIMPGMEVLLANPRGFCAGVDRAIEIVDRLLDAFGAPIYVRHEVVHNRFVVDGLRRRGAVFVDELHEVPDHATVVFSAHGVSRAVREEGQRRGLRVFDATCPLVTKVHIEVAQHCRAGRDVLMIGHAGHPEVEGTLGQWDDANPAGARIQLIETVEDAQRVQVRDPSLV